MWFRLIESNKLEINIVMRSRNTIIFYVRERKNHELDY